MQRKRIVNWHLNTNSTQTIEVSIWDRALQQLPNNWERGFLSAMRDICEDITRQQTHPHVHQQIAIHEEGEESITMEDFTIEYDNDSNSISHNVDNVNNVDNDNSNIIVYEHIDNVNSDNNSENNSICGDSAITDSMDNNLDNIGNETEKKKKNKRRGKKRIGQRTRHKKLKQKLTIN